MFALPVCLFVCLFSVLFLSASVFFATPIGTDGLYKKNKEIGLTEAVLVGNPVPWNQEIPRKDIEPIITSALKEVEKKGLRGKEITPFLLDLIARSNGGHSLKTNIALALNNIRLGVDIARELAGVT